MMHTVFSHHPLGFIVVVAAGIQIPVEPREVAAGDLEPDTMPGAEVVAGRVEINGEGVEGGGRHPDLLVEPFSITGAENAFLKVVSAPVREYINQFRCEVGVFG